MVLEGLENCPPRNEREQVLASRLGLEDSIRLACQTRPRGDLRVRRLVLDAQDIHITSQLAVENQTAEVGTERQVAILFSDIRGFTTLAERLYPYDVIHLLNRYFDRMVTIIEAHGGRVDNLIGDGILAVFCEGEARQQAIQAVNSGREMLASAREFAGYVQEAYAVSSFRIGVGVHSGLAVLGSVGRGRSLRQTVIGDAVNLASRVESSNKSFGTDFLISQEVQELIDGDVPTGREFETEIKGKSGCFRLYEVTS